MSSSSSATRAGGRVLRGARVDAATGLLGLALDRDGLGQLDPRRIEDAVADGYRTGYEAGRQAGEEAGRAAAAASIEAERRQRAAEWAALLSAAAAAVEDGRRQLAEVADALAERSAEAAFRLTEVLVGRELALATNPGVDAVARALAAAPTGVALDLHLHPGDAADLDLEAVEALAGPRDVTVVPDPAVTPGGCRAVAGTTEVDADLARALDRVRAVLLGTGA